MAILTRHNRAQPDYRVTVEEKVKDPFVLEFFGLKYEYSETEIEEALIRHLEAFLLELGGEFAFIGRQRRLLRGAGGRRHPAYRLHRLQGRGPRTDQVAGRAVCACGHQG